MIIGNGMLAKGFTALYQDDDNVVIFASGVSDSQTTSVESYQREESLLKEILHSLDNKLLVYFSTCSIDEPNAETMYTKHKLKLEQLIADKAQSYYIFRLSQVAGKSNKHGFFIHYLMYHISKGIEFNVWKNTNRNVIDIEDVVKIVSYMIDKSYMMNSVINIASPYNLKVLEYVKEIESRLDIEANYILVDKGSPFEIEIDIVHSLVDSIGVDFLTQKKYLSNLIEKYYKDIQ